MKILIVILFSIIVIKIDSQELVLDWAKTVGVTQSSSIRTDQNGNTYICGVFSSSVSTDFDPGPGTFYVVSGSGLSDAFVLKLDSIGNFAWVKTFGGIGFDYVFDMEISPSGAIYLTGEFEESVDFDPGSGNQTLTVANDFEKNSFILKLDSNGIFVWVQNLGGSGTVQSYALDLDNSENIYLTGGFTGTIEFPVSSGVSNLSGGFSTQSLFVICIDSAGNFVWAKNSQGGAAIGTSIEVDSSSNPIVGGVFNDSVDFNFSISDSILGNSSTNLFSFILKLNPNGDFVWVRANESVDGIYLHSLKTNNLNEIYSTGSYSGNVDFDPSLNVLSITSQGMRDVFIQKLSSSGDLLWVKSIGGLGYDSGYALDIDAQNNLWIQGLFSAIVDFNPGSGTFNLTSTTPFIGSRSNFLLKLNQMGDFITANSFFTDTQLPTFGDRLPFALYIDQNTNNIYSTSTFRGNCDFDPQSSIVNLSATPGQSNFFALKLHECYPTLSTIAQTSCGNYTWPLTGITYNNSGVYSYNSTSSNGCDSIIQLDLTIESINSNITIMDNNLTAIQTGATFQWLNCETNTQISGANSQTYTANTDGSYAVIITTANCVDTSNCVEVLFWNIEELNSTLSVSPNPTYSLLTVSNSSMIPFKIKVLDLAGKTLIDWSNESTEQVVDLSKFQNGVYLIAIKTEEKLIVKEIIKL